MEIKQFDFHGANVRTITDESGEPWFILKDVCALLDITNTAAVKKRVDQRDLNSTKVTTSDGHVSVNKTPKVTGKGQQYFIRRFLDGTFNPDNKAA